MATMKQSEILSAVKVGAVADLLPIFESKSAEQTGDFSYAFLVDVGDGQEHWADVTITAKTFMLDENGKRIPYDPFVKQAEWQADKEAKATAKAERERKHAETVKRAEERKAKRANKSAE